MKTWQKVGIGVGAVVILGSISWYSIYQSNKGVVTVQSGKVVKQDLVSIGRRSDPGQHIVVQHLSVE